MISCIVSRAPIFGAWPRPSLRCYECSSNSNFQSPRVRQTRLFCWPLSISLFATDNTIIAHLKLQCPKRSCLSPIYFILFSFRRRSRYQPTKTLVLFTHSYLRLPRNLVVGRGMSLQASLTSWYSNCPILNVSLGSWLVALRNAERERDGRDGVRVDDDDARGGGPIK